MDIPILGDAKQPTNDFVLGRPLLRVTVWINGTLVVPDGYGLVDTGSRTSAICRTKIGANWPDGRTDTHHGGGTGTTEFFSIASIQVEHFRQIPVTLSLFDGRHFDVIIGRDILRFCRLVMDPTTRTFTIDMP
jgi:hypothetical protein